MSKKRHDDLGDRMKCYENVTRHYLTRRMPVVIRLDGVAFHTFTKGFKEPFDSILWETMRETMKKLCKEVQNCVIGYTQSDEITLVLVDYYKLNTDVWFGNNIQKIVSVIASKCSIYFNEILQNKLINMVLSNKDDEEYYIKITNKAQAIFDARVFNVPKENIVNCLLWRQKDCIKNSVSSIAQSMFSHKKLHGKNSIERIEMINNKAMLSNLKKYDDYDEMYKVGTFVIRDIKNFEEFVSLNIKEYRNYFDGLFIF